MTPRSCGRCRGGPASTPAGVWRSWAASARSWCPTMVAGSAPSSWTSPAGPIVRASGCLIPAAWAVPSTAGAPAGRGRTASMLSRCCWRCGTSKNSPLPRPSRHRRRGDARHRRPASPAFRPCCRARHRSIRHCPPTWRLGSAPSIPRRRMPLTAPRRRLSSGCSTCSRAPRRRAARRRSAWPASRRGCARTARPAPAIPWKATGQRPHRGTCGPPIASSWLEWRGAGRPPG